MCGLCNIPVCDGLVHVQQRDQVWQSYASPATGTLDDIVSQLNRGDFSWNAASPITFTFAQALPAYGAGDSEYIGFEPFTDYQMDMARLALSTWSDVADIRFWELDQSYAKISFANSSTLADFSAAHAYYPSSGPWGGDVWVNSDLSYNLAPDVGGYGFKVLVHEIGHAIGQPHPGDYNANGGPMSYQTHAAYAEDTRQYSIMSYWDEENTGADFEDYSPQTPMLHDILAIQAKYGANMETRAGDTVYGFNSNTGSAIFDFTSNAHPVLSIWDAGGTDTLDLSGFSQDAIINLVPGTFTDAAGLKGNISIAYGAIIENAVAGSGDDIIIGNAWDNIIQAGSGNDLFHIETSEAEAEVFVFDDGRSVVASSQGIDQIAGVESLSFTDGHLELASAMQHSLLEYAASYHDIADAFGTDTDSLYKHLIEYGLSEGRTIEFSALEYIASHEDLIDAFGADAEAGARHYIEYGRFEERGISFSAHEYLASNANLKDMLDADTTAGAIHFIEAGRAEDRASSFDNPSGPASVGLAGAAPDVAAANLSFWT